MFDLLTVFLLFTSAVTGALFYRIRGGPLAEWPRPLEQMAFCLIYGVVMDAFSVHYGLNISGYALAVVAVLTGHGLYFIEGAIKPIEPERLDFIVRALYGPDPRCDEKYSKFWGKNTYTIPEAWRDEYDLALEDIAAKVRSYGINKLKIRNSIGMAVTGGVVSLAPGLMVALSGHVVAGVLIALIGAITKPAAYLISDYFKQSTELAEWLFGGFVWFFTAFVAVLFAGLSC